MIANTNTRVENNSDPRINDRIREQLRETVARYETASPRELTYRLAELDQEWDVERFLELGFSGIVLTGLVLGTLSNRKWYLGPALAACFMVQHVTQGWCPPLVVLRRLGVRTAAEINRERIAIKIVRGDFADLGAQATADSNGLLRAIEA